MYAGTFCDGESAELGGSRMHEALRPDQAWLVGPIEALSDVVTKAD